MEAKIWIDELEQDVTFTANMIYTTGPMATNPKYYLDEIGWEMEKYTAQENVIIETHFEEAVSALFDAIKQEANENY